MILAIDTTDNVVHEITHLTAVTRGWMLRNYWRHLAEDGRVDVEALAEQAVYEFGIDRPTAADLAALVAAEVDNRRPEGA